MLPVTPIQGLWRYGGEWHSKDQNAKGKLNLLLMSPREEMAACLPGPEEEPGLDQKTEQGGESLGHRLCRSSQEKGKAGQGE